MKSLKYFLLLPVMALSFYSFSQENRPIEAKKKETITIKTSAQCDMCKERIEKALAYTKGVKKSNLEVESKMITVVYNPAKTSPEKLRKAISKAGYDADSIPADTIAYENLPGCCKKGGH